MRAVALAVFAIAALAAPAFAEAGLAHVGGATYGEARITASTARYWNNCAEGVMVGAETALCDCGRIIGARLSRTRTGSAYYYRGHAYRDVGRLEQARTDFEQAVQVFNQILLSDEENALALYGRGLSLVGLGRQSEGAADMERAAGIDPDVADNFRHRVEF